MKWMGLIVLLIGQFLFAQAAQADWTPAKRLTWTSGYINFPSLAADSFDNLHVVWDDNTPGNYEVDYRKYVQ